MYDDGKKTRQILDGGSRCVGAFSGVICNERNDLLAWFRDFSPLLDGLPLADLVLPIGILFEIKIRKESRGQKLASPALKFFAKWCVEGGCTQVLLNAVEQKDSPLNLYELVRWYEKYGFKKIGESGLGQFMLWTNESLPTEL